MSARPLTPAGLVLFEPDYFADARGGFFESFNARGFAAATGLDPVFVQDNQSVSHRDVLRGLHYQLPPHAQGKLVRVVAGAIWDVAVDIRRGSPSFGQWRGVELSADNRLQLWVPPGFAHGFVALGAGAAVAYKTTAFWHAASERTIRWDDPALGIAWPLAGAPVNSAKDAAGAAFSAAELFDLR
jgi:dTDP-4-dehydrorhamnose 3,5-epimerase